jgi:hypothetical protein
MNWTLMAKMLGWWFVSIPALCAVVTVAYFVWGTIDKESAHDAWKVTRGISSLTLLLVIGLILLLCSGCVATDWIKGKVIPGIDFEGTNSAPVAVIDSNETVIVPEVIVPATGEERIADIGGDRASIAVAPDGKLYVMWDKGIGDIVWTAERDGMGWQKYRVFAKGADYDAARVFLPHVGVDSLGRPWYSAKLGVKGTTHKGGGVGLWCPGAFVLVHPKGGGDAAVRGNGNVCVVNDAGTLVGSDGNYERYAADGTRLDKGRWPIGSSGEKIRAVAEGGVYHLAMNGCKGQQATYINSTMKKPVAWADYATYPEMGVDTVHPSICADSDVTYIASQYSKGIFVNVWDGKRMLYSPTNLLLVAASGYTGADRMGPQMCRAQGGGVWIAYCKDKRVKMRKIMPDGTIAVVRDICAGRCPTIAAGKDGVHMVYDNGGMKYRRAVCQ